MDWTNRIHVGHALRVQPEIASGAQTGRGQWRRQLVGTWARAPLAFENFFSLYVETSCLVWFGTMPNSKSPLGYLFSRIRFGMIS